MAVTTTASTRTQTSYVGSNGIGWMIRNLRKTRSWSQEDLALEADVSVSTVKNVEAGADISIKNLAKIARALGYELKIDIAPKAGRS